MSISRAFVRDPSGTILKYSDHFVLGTPPLDVLYYAATGTVEDMLVSIAEASKILGVSPRRVRSLIEHELVRAQKISGRWAVDPGSLSRAPLRARPMSPRNAWALVLEDSSWISPQSSWKLRERIGGLMDRPNPELVLASWLKNRAPRIEFSSPSPAELLDDDRVVPSGVSDDRSNMASLRKIEAYIHEDDFDDIKYDHMLVESKSPNVVLHVAPVDVPRPVPIALMIADLVEWGGPREKSQASKMVKELPWNQ